MKVPYMANQKGEVLAGTIFAASLTLNAILIGVISIFEGQIQDYRNSGLDYLLKNTTLLQSVSTLLFVLCCWCAFWSLMFLMGASRFVAIFTLPMTLSVVGLAVFVPFWVWGL